MYVCVTERERMLAGRNICGNREKKRDGHMPSVAGALFLSLSLSTTTEQLAAHSLFSLDVLLDQVTCYHLQSPPSPSSAHILAVLPLASEFSVDKMTACG